MLLEVNQYVRTRVPTMGHDGNDEERDYPIGAIGFIDEIDERGIMHVVVGPVGSDDSIVQYFDVGAEADAAMEPFELPQICATMVVNGNTEGFDCKTLDEAAERAARFIRGIPLDAVGVDYRVEIFLSRGD